MKKQFFLLIVIIFTGVCFSSLKDNSLKACDANTSAGSAIRKNSKHRMQDEYVEDMDASFNMFMNPFKPL